jgi:hypothetical protein
VVGVVGPQVEHGPQERVRLQETRRHVLD